MTDTESRLDDSRYQAVSSRDARFDGEFFTAVKTTGIYCRPSCPAVTPKRENVRFYPSAAAAQGAGFRACRRCRPDTAPGSAEWNVRADLVGRAMRLIGDGVVDREGVAGLAHRLGYSSRQVNRQLTEELGAGPVALARAQRAHTARVLLQTTRMPITEIAFAAGFASVRQFNDTVRAVYARTPSELRGRPAAAHDDGRAPAGIPLRLAHRGPYAADEIFTFLQRRAIAGIEETTGEGGARRYRRTLRLPYGTGVAEVREPGPGQGAWLDCRLLLTDHRDLSTAVQRVRRLFDLDADPFAVAERLGADPRLRPLVDARPGLRSPGAADGEELAIRAVLGQQVSVAAAARLAATLVAAYGKPLPAPDGTLTHVFPDPGTLADAPLDELGMPRARRNALRTIAGALADGTVRLDPGVDRDAAEGALRALPGIGPWTAGYIRMRALGDPDVFLQGDAGVRHGLAAVGATPADAEEWRPWSSYAVHHLWNRVAPPVTAAL
ncbi:AraC family transcriptional regulator [Streptomyces cinnamoneus]|uniref:DNA-3-methyladenine glycosylase II n=1 Tax=Streptomyces cinnamoneus TaxID=53446 RepID=A0A2G1XA49_STRCJ|nr:DNA-3-methyladenine glycosylase 2 family protein [Streptomyces cinnamoneus]PHQ48039.1 AraC family transcriptional regulator [Streptomyces cinnamoneus]PPT15665.1 DNA-3-methyladenine glycosylase 2 family protein [Streptomyces cinnamoneus]